MRNALASVAAGGDSEGQGLPATWGHAPSSSGIFSDLFGIARPIGQMICWDYLGHHYLCKVYEISQRPEIERAIFMFAERVGDCYLPRRIGHAKSGEQGIPSGEQLAAAAAAGCSHILVHDAPTIFTDLEDIERRLVATFDPVMNKKRIANSE
jgi:hypothetical protein